MSGGVDSSVAAGLLVQQGYDVTGAFMCMNLGQPTSNDSSENPPETPSPHDNAAGPSSEPAATKPANQTCCSPQDGADARAVATRLGAGFFVLNFGRDLQTVVDYFVAEYARGRTPNPCVICNSRLKFGKLLSYARAAGMDAIATGHYARIEQLEGQARLLRGVDDSKDQSYALFGIRREDLASVMFPNGQYTKQEIRDFARQMKLAVHDKSESQEICFVPDDDYPAFVAERAPELVRPGKVVNTAGEVLGEHQGVYRYTIGQRRGLGIALGEPAYVVRIDAASNTVVLGNGNDLLRKELEVTGVNWHADRQPDVAFEAMVQIRYNHRGERALVRPTLDEAGALSRASVRFYEPARAVTPGQAAVFYEGDAVVGGGWIE